MPQVSNNIFKLDIETEFQDRIRQDSSQLFEDGGVVMNATLLKRHIEETHPIVNIINYLKKQRENDKKT